MMLHAVLSEAPRPRGFVELFQSTGFFGPLLVLLGVAALFLAIRRFLELRSESLAPEALQKDLERSVRERKSGEGFDQAAASRSCLGDMVAAGLSLRQAGLDDMLANVERTAIKTSLRISNRIANLGRLGVVILLIGLLGTVLCLMNTMLVLEMLAQPRVSDVFSGLVEALTCTALGLGVGLPCFAAQFLLENRLARRTLDVREIAEELMRAAASGNAVDVPRACPVHPGRRE